MSEWISIKDKLPENNEVVFVYGILEHQELPEVHKATFHSEIKNIYHQDDLILEKYSYNQFWENEWSYEFEEITHWMPLPEPPKE